MKVKPDEGNEVQLFRAFKMRRKDRGGKWELWWYDPPGQKKYYKSRTIGHVSARVAQQNLDILQAQLNQQLLARIGSETLPEKPSAKKMGKEGIAVMLLAKHPELTDKEIAAKAGCNVKSLYRMPLFRGAKKLLSEGRKDLAKGSKSEAGRIEAWDS
jgi:hypothetical protein